MGTIVYSNWHLLLFAGWLAVWHVIISHSHPEAGCCGYSFHVLRAFLGKETVTHTADALAWSSPGRKGWCWDRDLDTIILMFKLWNGLAELALFLHTWSCSSIFFPMLTFYCLYVLWSNLLIFKVQVTSNFLTAPLSIWQFSFVKCRDPLGLNT